jgi:hypothetical protein
MMLSIARVFFCALLACSLIIAGCGKKESKSGEVASPPSGQAQKKKTTVVIPPAVNGKWKAVKIAVTDKKARKETIYTVGIGANLAIPNTAVNIKVEAFLPHFTMEGTTLTSLSNEPKNPAAQVQISEHGKEIFNGWLFSLYPTTHALQHPVFGFTLVDFIPVN